MNSNPIESTNVYEFLDKKHKAIFNYVGSEMFIFYLMTAWFEGNLDIREWFNSNRSWQEVTPDYDFGMYHKEYKGPEFKPKL